MREHIGTEVVEYLLPCPGHRPHLPVLSLPHANVHRQQDYAKYRQSPQIAVCDELVDSHTNQVGVRQAEGRVEQHQHHARNSRQAVTGKVGDEFADKVPVELPRYILVVALQAVFAPATESTAFSVGASLHRATSRS